MRTNSASYEHIKGQARKEGRYRCREGEVAARTVMKQHSRLDEYESA